MAGRPCLAQRRTGISGCSPVPVHAWWCFSGKNHGGHQRHYAQGRWPARPTAYRRAVRSTSTMVLSCTVTLLSLSLFLPNVVI